MLIRPYIRPNKQGGIDYVSANAELFADCGWHALYIQTGSVIKMKQAKTPDDEQQRLKLLQDTGILDTLEEQAYDDLTQLAAEICGTPIALVSLIDKDRQWFKSHYGLNARETPREFAFCAHAILNDELFIVEDASQDDRFHDNPLYTGDPHVKFYAGAPLIMSNHVRLGTLCVIANQSRTLTDAQKNSLTALARQVVSQLELRLRLKELESLDHAKNEFIAMVSHELRTPLTAIYGALSLFTNNNAALDKNNATLISMAYRNTKRLLSIVNDILDVVTLNSGKLQLYRERISLKQLLEDAIGLNQSFCADCNTSLVLHYPGDKDIIVRCDAQRILQVLSNLISNAAKFTFDNDIIEISCSSDGKQAFVMVTDHGPGIPPDKQHLLFKKFQQLAARVNNKHPGTGLGLNICKNIIQLHSGDIDVESIADVKTSFRFSLPLA